MLPLGFPATREDHVMSDSPARPGPSADVDPLTAFDPARGEPDLRDIERQAGVRAL
jgi:hypothetical protein